VHVPPAYLVQMFGAGVAHAIAGYRKAADDEKLLGALLLFGATPMIIHHYAVRNGIAIGWDEKGEELVRVPLTEPIHVRPVFDEQYQAYRTNIT
jgi:nitrate reductase beta subunit